MRKLDDIYEVLYVRRKASIAIRMMLGLIHSLPEKDKKNLDEILKTLEEYKRNVLFCKDGDLEKLYSKLYNYLHLTILSEVASGIIPASMFKGDKKRPEAKAYPKILSSEVQ